MLEALDELHVAPAREPALHAVPEPVHVEERQRSEVAVGARDAPRGHDGERVRGEVAVSEHGALGDAGGAGRVDQRRGRAGVAADRAALRRAPLGLALELFHVPERRSSREVPRARRAGHDRLRLRVPDDVTDLVPFVEHVDRQDDHAELHRGEPEVDDREAVRQAEGEAVALHEAARREELREPVAPRVELAERQRARAARGIIDLERRRALPAAE